MREVPLRTLHASQTQWNELRREVRLLSLAHEDDYPLAKSLSELFADLDRILREGIHSDAIESALESGEATTDLRVDVPKASADTIEQFLDLLDLADEFCQKQRLLSLARTPEQRRFQRWLFGEFVRQQRGESPRPWPGMSASPGHAQLTRRPGRVEAREPHRPKPNESGTSVDRVRHDRYPGVEGGLRCRPARHW